ncbi:winged helix-turn-helix domain-containing protein [Haloferula sp. A504]|uniref:winged helix-turn-helix domain-containing protein n=1 Tax=Haloferula sp. A504 TaxID=3373601 RepID=UPI0031BD5819|nr:winged helix-turn-helix domain-containing protein [Verrucomicrobiaceae bacterium E54]
MISTVLQDLFGGKAAEAVLLCLFHQGEAYGRAVSRDLGVSLDSVQRQLDRFERSGALVCQRQGRTLIYRWNPKSRIAARLKDLVGVVYDGLGLEVKEKIFPQRHHPRAKDKPVIQS